MLSLSAGVLLFIACLYSGSGIRHYYKIRVAYFEEIIKLCDLLIDEITYLKTPLLNIIKEFKNLSQSKLKTQVSFFIDKLESNVILEKEDFNIFIKETFLKNHEKECVIEFLSMLGKSHAESQIVNIKHYKIKFDSFLKINKEEYNIYGVLAYKLGILLGIALMIIVV